MASRLAVRLMGIVAHIVFDESVDGAIRDEIAAAWDDLKVDASVPHDLVVTVLSGEHASGPQSDVFVSTGPEEGLGERLASELTLAALERMSGRALMLHASAVAMDDGRVVGFVGPSGRGKTTAMSVLAQTHRYVTDETLAVTKDGSVIPYPKPLLIGRRPEVKTAHSASSMGLRLVSDGALRLGALVLLDRREEHAPPVVAVVPLVEAMIELAGESSYLSALDAPLRTIANLLVATGGARRLTYTEAESLPAALEQIIATAGQESPEIREVPPLPSGTAPSGWTRAPYADALQVDGRLIVLHEQTITVLDGIGPALWTAATGVSVEQLTQAVLCQHPAPPDLQDPAATVGSVIGELAQAGLLRRV